MDSIKKAIIAYGRSAFEHLRKWAEEDDDEPQPQQVGPYYREKEDDDEPEFNGQINVFNIHITGGYNQINGVSGYDPRFGRKRPR